VVHLAAGSFFVFSLQIRTMIAARWLSWIALLLVALGSLAAAAEHKTLLLLGQNPDSHPRGTHEYVAGLDVLAGLLETTGGLRIRQAKADEPWLEGPEMLEGADGVVLFLAEGARWVQAEPRRHQALSKLAARGGGLVALHWAMGTKAPEPIEPFLKLFGGCHGGADRKYQVLETELRIADPQHPLAAGLTPFRVRDEFYYQLKFVKAVPEVRPVLQALIDGRQETVAWSWDRPDGGRSFGFSGLHFHDNWKMAEYRKLLAQAVLWTLKIPAQSSAAE
jgi:type 1 glutamine amidotransferase